MPEQKKRAQRDYTADDLARQSTAARALIHETLDRDEQDDEALVHDTVEGETSFFEAVEKALEEIVLADAMAGGLKLQIEKLTKRMKRAEFRSTKLKSAIEQAFAIAEPGSHTFDLATISPKKVPIKLVVEDESKIPSKYFVAQDPKLDRKKLWDDVKGGETVPGATKSNGGETIQIRWS